MPAKLQGVDPRPPGPRQPAVPVESLPADTEGLLHLWRPQAVLRAQQGQREVKIVRFLVSKGVEQAAAVEEARAILADPATIHPQAGEAARVLGIVLLLLGLVAPVLCFAMDLEGWVKQAVLAASVAVVMLAGGLFWSAAKRSP